jgi:hypothetical protein
MLFETISHVSDGLYDKERPRLIYFWLNRNILLSKKNSVSRTNQQAALLHIYCSRNTIEQIEYDRSSEYNKANLLAEIKCRNHNLSLLRQHPVNQPFFSICVYTTAALERVLRNYAVLLWFKIGQPFLRLCPLLIFIYFPLNDQITVHTFASDKTVSEIPRTFFRN